MEAVELKMSAFLFDAAKSSMVTSSHCRVSVLAIDEVSCKRERAASFFFELAT